MAGLKIYVRREGSILAPASAEAQEAIRSLPLDTVLRADVVRQRSAEQSNLYWAVCWRVAQLMNDMGDDQANKDNVSDRIKIATGHCGVTVMSPAMQLQTGHRYSTAPHSIKFHLMDQGEFNPFMDRVTAFVLVELLPHMPTGELRRIIRDILTNPRRRAA